jgi:hypothetical protein
LTTSCKTSGTSSASSCSAQPQVRLPDVQPGDGQPHPTGTLIASVATLLGAERLGRPQIALPSRDSVKTVITADHPIPAAIRADLTAREALAEMTADGMLIAAGSGTLGGSDEITLSFRLL